MGFGKNKKLSAPRPKKKKGPDPHWMTSNELTHINFVKKGMVKHLPQFDIPELPEGVVPPMTPSMREKMLLEKGPDEVAADLKGRTFHSDIFNAMPPPPPHRSGSYRDCGVGA